MRLELESICQTAPIGLAVPDTDLRFLRVNERPAEMAGGTPVWPGVLRIWREQVTPLRDQSGAIDRLSWASG